MNIYINVLNIKWHDMFRPLLGHHQVSVSVNVLLYPILAHTSGWLYTIALVRSHYLKVSEAETGCINNLPVKCETIAKIKITIYI
jgi:hypothetical protein